MKPLFMKPLYEGHRTRVVYVRLREINTMSDSVDSYRIEWLDKDGRWAHWAQVLYLSMAKKIARDRSGELYSRDREAARMGR